MTGALKFSPLLMPVAAWHLKTLKMQPVTACTMSTVLFTVLIWQWHISCPAGCCRSGDRWRTGGLPHLCVQGEAYRHYEPDLRRSRPSARARRPLAHRDQITALDLAGDELVSREVCSSHFNRARDAGWHITVHAGEAAGPESIWQAIRELGAERIGHGVKAIGRSGADGFSRRATNWY